MPQVVRVSPSQADAAKMIVERNAAKGQETSEAIRKIADAEGSHATTMLELIDRATDDPHKVFLLVAVVSVPVFLAAIVAFSLVLLVINHHAIIASLAGVAVGVGVSFGALPLWVWLKKRQHTDRHKR